MADIGAGTVLATVGRGTTMLRLTARRRAVLADKVPDIVNLITAAIFIGLVVGEPRSSWALVALGFGVWSIVMLFAVIIAEGK